MARLRGLCSSKLIAGGPWPAADQTWPRSLASGALAVGPHCTAMRARTFEPDYWLGHALSA